MTLRKKSAFLFLVGFVCLVLTAWGYLYDKAEFRKRDMRATAEVIDYSYEKKGHTKKFCRFALEFKDENDVAYIFSPEDYARKERWNPEFEKAMAQQHARQVDEIKARVAKQDGLLVPPPRVVSPDELYKPRDNAVYIDRRLNGPCLNKEEFKATDVLEVAYSKNAPQDALVVYDNYAGLFPLFLGMFFLFCAYMERRKSERLASHEDKPV
ncbi:MAG: hypothetical protein LBU53_03645 [Zoogloeaceae bacterium]|jgi:hypothetical protein|nr:hypothetical protein [Zoogloeaceae bacterium]